jgi:hypothetical protein
MGQASTGQRLTQRLTGVMGGRRPSLYHEIVLREPSLASYWRLGESSGVFADSKSGHDLTVSGGVTRDVAGLVVGSDDAASEFDGSSGMASLGSSAIYAYERTQAWTVEALVQPELVRSADFESRVVLSKLLNTSPYTGYEVSIQWRNSDQRAAVQVYIVNTLTTNAVEVRGSRNLEDGQIYHVAVTYDGSSTSAGVRIFVNGIEDNPTVITDTLSGSIATSETVSVGARPAAAEFYSGVLDEVAFYSSALTPAHVVRHYAASLVPETYSQLGSPSQPVRLIIDTDCNTDAEDAAALAVAHALMSNSECNLLATVVNVSNTDVPHAVDAINTYYGRGSIPIGRYTGTPEVEPTAGSHTFPAYMKDNFPNDIDGATAPSGVSVYRQALAAQPDGSVVIVSLGFGTNLKALLDSESDVHSALSGLEIIAAKVSKLVVMGGVYNGHITGIENNAEYNFWIDPATWTYLVANWPGRVCFLGFEVGPPVKPGTLLTSTPIGNPVRAAYEQDGFAVSGRDAWDELSVLYAVRGAGGGFREIPGINVVNATNGVNAFTYGANGTHRVVYSTATNSARTGQLNTLQTQAP